MKLTLVKKINTLSEEKVQLLFGLLDRMRAFQFLLDTGKGLAHVVVSAEEN